MIRAYLIPALAIAGLIFALVTVVKGSKPPAATPPAIQPPTAPFERFVAGAGLVETSTQNILIGSPVGALVAKVSAKVGQSVEAGDELFTLDTRELAARLTESEAALGVAESQLARLEAGTRPELIPPQRARVAQAEAEVAASESETADLSVWLKDAESQLARAESADVKGAVSPEELDRRKAVVGSYRARVGVAGAKTTVASRKLDEARGQLDLLLAGSWKPDVEVARSQVAQARAAVEAARIEIDRRTVRAPVKGRVLQVNVRPGEFAPAGVLATPLMVVGGVDPLHVRVDVDEHEAWRVREGAPAVAFARGNQAIRAELTFVRFEPLIVPKRSLTGDSTERVDTRVLQVIYRFDPAGAALFVGQQVDVFIRAEEGPVKTLGLGTAKEGGT
ncbi:MAG: HlyD family efflux transporter periplasmic adaptor subunit [Leptolyngbya sp. PLA1]|nr:HlyD family efflux transporter periplasmic adaptor subunit [Leptolyngbya sp. PLA1]